MSLIPATIVMLRRLAVLGEPGAGKSFSLERIACEAARRALRDPAAPVPLLLRLADLLRQRIFALALGHEDLIDHDALRFDPALTAALGKPEEALAGKEVGAQVALQLEPDEAFLVAVKRLGTADELAGAVCGNGVRMTWRFW